MTATEVVVTLMQNKPSSASSSSSSSPSASSSSSRYQWPHVTHFDSWDDLARRLCETDLGAVSVAMAAHNAVVLHDLRRTWGTLLLPRIFAGTRPAAAATHHPRRQLAAAGEAAPGDNDTQLTLGEYVLNQQLPDLRTSQVLIADRKDGTARVACEGTLHRLPSSLAAVPFQLCVKVNDGEPQCSNIDLSEAKPPLPFTYRFDLDGFKPGTHVVAMGLLVLDDDEEENYPLEWLVPATVEVLPPDK